MRATWASRGTGERDAGASAVEYGLLVFAIAAAIVAAAFAFTNATNGVFVSSCDHFAEARPEFDCRPTGS